MLLCLSVCPSIHLSIWERRVKWEAGSGGGGWGKRGGGGGVGGLVKGVWQCPVLLWQFSVSLKFYRNKKLSKNEKKKKPFSLTFPPMTGEMTLIPSINLIVYNCYKLWDWLARKTSPKVKKEGKFSFENEVSGVSFNQINMVLGSQYFKKTYKVPRKFSFRKIQISPALWWTQ